MPNYLLFIHFLVITFYSKLSDQYKVKYQICSSSGYLNKDMRNNRAFNAVYNMSMEHNGYNASYDVSFICEVYKNNYDKITNIEFPLLRNCFSAFWLKNKYINSFVTSIYWYSNSKIKVSVHFSDLDLIDKISYLFLYSLHGLLEVSNITYIKTYLDPLLQRVFNDDVN